MVCPDLRPTRSFAVNKKELDEVRGGIASLIAGARRQHDGIAILYDQTAVHAATAHSHPSHLVESYQAFQDLLEDLGLQYDYVAGAQIAAGALRKEGHKLLLLAHALALSDAAAGAIRQFVRDGGTVIADTLPARYDYTLRPAAGGSLLADLFGQPGETRQVGAGKAILLKAAPAGYGRDREKPAGAQARALFAPLVRDAGVRPWVTLAPAAAGLEVVTYRRDGDARVGTGGAAYVGILRDAGGEARVEANVSQPLHVYDVRAQRYLGKVAQWDVTAGEGDTRLFALLPYKVAGVKAALPAGPAQPGKECAFEVALQVEPVGPLAPHALSVAVRDPDGRPRPEYGSVLITNAQGRATVRIPFALNDPTGVWKASVSDTASGSKVEVPLPLR